MLEILLLGLLVFMIFYFEKPEKKPTLEMEDVSEEDAEVATPYRPLYSEDFNATRDTPVYNVL